jgi:hypothetical protein
LFFENRVAVYAVDTFGRFANVRGRETQHGGVEVRDEFEHGLANQLLEFFELRGKPLAIVVFLQVAQESDAFDGEAFEFHIRYL